MKKLMVSKFCPPQTLQQAVIYFSDEENCIRQMISIRWKAGLCCPRCGDVDVTRIRRITRKQYRAIWKCNGCKKQFSLKVGTIFEDSPLPLSKWFVAIWLLTCAKNGISSCELARAIGVTQKTGWFVFHRIREAIRAGSIEKFNGTVEADEAYVGGLEKNKHEHKKLNQGRGAVGKAIVMGILERGDHKRTSKIHADMVFSTASVTLQAKVRDVVSERAILYTDAHKGYCGLSGEYAHEFVDHAVAYVSGNVHTNGIENFWSLLKRSLKGTYVSVEPFHLKRYIDEQVFRFNSRDGSDADRFVAALSKVQGKRLTFDQLTRSYEAYYDHVYA